MKFDLLIKNGTALITGENNQIAEVKADIAIKDQKIASIGEIPTDQAKEILDAQGLHVLPGLIDTQVHFREPGGEHKEDLASGSLGALAGGITGVFEMPNTNPPVTTAAHLTDKVNRATDRMWTHFAFFMGASPENVGALREIENTPGCCGIKVFMGSSTGNLLIDDRDLLEAVLVGSSRMISVHSEDESRLKERFKIVKDDPGKVHLHPVWRDEETAISATRTLIELAVQHKRRVHILHITTEQELEMLSKVKEFVSVECTPQHLHLHAPDCYDRMGTLVQMNPPIREEKHKKALWRAIENRVVDVIGSDHAPHTQEEKSKTYPGTPSGIPGVQTTIPLLLNSINEGKLSLIRLVELMAQRPCEIFSVKNKGAIKEGFDADFTIVDMNKTQKMENHWIKSKCGYTPFDGQEIKGWPVYTLLNGKVAMKDGEVLGKAQGQVYEFNI